MCLRCALALLLAAAALVAPVVLTAVPAFASTEPRFAWPIACTLGETCFVQNYVDTDPGPGAADFTCGSLTYDGHKGTDIRLPDYVAMAQGVAVLAAAPGTVLRTRDGMADISVRETGAEAIKNREAGNSVIIDHGDRWVTQYAHMKQGSIAVKPGQQVAAGDKLGEVGLSGNTEFPHLHFEVRHDDRPVDPFTDEPMAAGCGTADHPLWQPELAAATAYRPSGLLRSGFATARPDSDRARHGDYAAVGFAADSPALVLWVNLFGLQPGDHLVLRLTDPTGAALAENDQPIDRAKAQYFAFTGAKRPAAGWSPGSYRGSFQLLRGGSTVLEGETEITLQ